MLENINNQARVLRKQIAVGRLTYLAGKRALLELWYDVFGGFHGDVALVAKVLDAF